MWRGRQSTRTTTSLLFDKRILRLCGALFALSRLSAIFFCHGGHAITPVGLVDDERGRCRVVPVQVPWSAKKENRLVLGFSRL
jgi:hypothetical protein